MLLIWNGKEENEEEDEEQDEEKDEEEEEDEDEDEEEIKKARAENKIQRPFILRLSCSMSN